VKNLNELKIEKEAKITDLINESLMFFAFSNEQFQQNKTPLQEGEKYVSLGAGAYLPKSKVEIYIKGTKSIDEWFKSTVKSNKLKTANILYELNNHEAFYTNDLESTLSTLGEDYTEEEVRKVFNENKIN